MGKRGSVCRAVCLCALPAGTVCLILFPINTLPSLFIIRNILVHSGKELFDRVEFCPGPFCPFGTHEIIKSQIF